jgi:hypothetical protein
LSTLTFIESSSLFQIFGYEICFFRASIRESSLYVKEKGHGNIYRGVDT